MKISQPWIDYGYRVPLTFRDEIYGRTIESWLLYNRLPLFINNQLYVISLDEAYIELSVPFTHFCALRGTYV